MTSPGGGIPSPPLLLMLFLLPLLLHVHPASTCDPGDLNALRAFFDLLESSSPGWNLTLTSPDCCSWSGVSCGDVGRRVTGLHLFNCTLKGPISSSLADLSHLRYLNLSTNLLTGPVPPGLLALPLLEHLDLSVNLLSSTIPAGSVDLPSIKTFNISYNMFNGSHPVPGRAAGMVKYDVTFNLFSGRINTSICASSPHARYLRFSVNEFDGEFPAGFGNCSGLVQLGLDFNGISGNIPDDIFTLGSLLGLYLQSNKLSGRLSPRIGNLSSLVELDLCLNAFSGDLPISFSRLSNLEYLSLHSNLLVGPLPSSLSNLSSLQVLNLRNNSLSGRIDLNFTALARLDSLDLGSNLFTGPIPVGLSQCVEMKTLNLARNRLKGTIPASFANLTELSYISLSNNSLSNLASALEVLRHCKNLISVVLTMNFYGGERIPMDGISGFENIEVFVIANCGLLGSVPPWLCTFSNLKVLDLSWNELEGTIPPWLGDLNSLFYVDLSNNSLQGELPSSLTQMKGLIYPHASRQDASQLDFPFFVKRNTTSKGLQYNQLSHFPPSLILSNNMLVGPILPGFGGLKMLHVLDLSHNNLTGIIPEELSGMVGIENLDLSHNNLTGSIPSEFTSLTFLSKFSVAYNNLVGPVPLDGQFSTFSSDAFDGNPGLCFHQMSCSDDDRLLQKRNRGRKNKGAIIGIATGIGLGTVSLLAIVYLFVVKTHSTKREAIMKDVSNRCGQTDSPSSTLVLLFQNKDNKELSITDILRSTNNFDQSNIIGCGGFGLVYKASLPDGRMVAIKQLSGDYGQMEREFQAEVETLSRAQHRNLVLLQGYCRIGNDRILIYSYMENGSLDYWLHEKFEGGCMLDWDTRLRIAQGAARGLAYLHQYCEPHILHRDVKSSNILLDENFEAHLADFGLARLVLPYDTHVTTDLVGTLGYIPPEYGQASMATFKGDIYSFGVVLLELLTSKRPVDMCKPRGARDLVSWMFEMREKRKDTKVFDPFIYDKKHDEQLMQVLEITCLCLNECPKLRPSTQQLLAWLDNVGVDGQLTK